MKRLFSSILVLVFSCYLVAQAPDLDYYSQLGFSIGYGNEKFQGQIQNKGLSIGIVHGSVIYKSVFMEGSAINFGLYKGGDNKLHSMTFDGFVYDVGLGYSSENFFIGVAPLSVNLTASSNLGMAVLSKVKLMRHFVIENKFMPFVYGDSQNYGLFNNNFFVGLHYWHSDYFSLGLRYNKYLDMGNFSLMFSWNLL